ncbi:hypothetical protein ccbrp13_56940 [Ktedonobacteria bacterium brp13]|nr:hypothetical protein ccbrp13_56940 [Ktedonobacteria bacterium brp13]
MQSVSQIEDHLKFVMEERAPVLARETGCIQREKKFDGADLLQTLVFGWLAHPDGSLEHLASTAATRDVLVSDTAIHKRFNIVRHGSNECDSFERSGQPKINSEMAF